MYLSIKNHVEVSVVSIYIIHNGNYLLPLARNLAKEIEHVFRDSKNIDVLMGEWIETYIP